MAISKSRTSAIFLLAIVFLELALVSYYVPQVEASKRKIMKKIKQLKDLLPLIMALKAKKKKLIILPLPIPMKGDMDMKMNMNMDNYQMPQMMMDPCPIQMQYPMMDCGGGNDFGGSQMGGYGGNFGGGNGGGGYGGGNGNFRGGNGGGNGGGY